MITWSDSWYFSNSAGILALLCCRNRLKSNSVNSTWHIAFVQLFVLERLFKKLNRSSLALDQE